MEYYKKIANEIQNKVYSNELTVEQANLVNDLAYQKYVIESDLSKEEKKKIKENYKKKQMSIEDKKYGGRIVNTSRKNIETLDKSHKYINKLAKNRDDESDKKIATAYKAIRHITKSPENSTIEYSTMKDYTGKKYGDDEDYKKDEDGYFYSVTSYPHSKKNNDNKPVIAKDETLVHLTNKNYTGNPRPSQYSFGHSKNSEYEKTTRLHPKKRIYGFPESDESIKRYKSYGDTKKVIKTNGKPIYKNAESDEGGFIEYESANEYYRVTYDGTGIYQALKNNLTKSEDGKTVWKEFLKKEDWLPKPETYGNKNYSYFTKYGYDKFLSSDDYKLMKKYLDNNLIKTNKVTLDDDEIVYKDKYQVITENS